MAKTHDPYNRWWLSLGLSDYCALTLAAATAAATAVAGSASEPLMQEHWGYLHSALERETGVHNG